MKSIFKICSLLCVSAVLLTSCETDAEGTKWNMTGQDIAFNTQITVHQLVAADNGQTYAILSRGDNSASYTANVTMEDESGLFTLATPSVTFDQGKNTAKVLIGFELDNLDPEETYDITLRLGASALDLSPKLGADTTSLRVQRTPVYESIGTGYFVSTMWDKNEIYEWDQQVMMVPGTRMYRLPDLYNAGYPIDFILKEDGSMKSFPLQSMGWYYNDTYGWVHFGAFNASNYIQKEGNKITIRGFLGFSSGSGFGHYTEVLTLPE